MAPAYTTSQRFLLNQNCLGIVGPNSCQLSGKLGGSKGPLTLNPEPQ